MILEKNISSSVLLTYYINFSAFSQSGVSFKMFIKKKENEKKDYFLVITLVTPSVIIDNAGLISLVLRDIWFVSSTGQTCPEGRSTNRTRGPMRGAPPYPIQTRKTRPQHRELHALLFTTSVRVLLRPTGL